MKINDPTPKSFLDHLEDLRWVLIKAAVAFAVCFAASLALTKPLLQLLYVPLRAAGQDPGSMLRVLGVADPLGIQIELGLMAGLLLSLPFILYFIGQFLLPALTPREARALLPSFVAGAVLFVGGVLFAYCLIVPKMIRFFIWYNHFLDFRTDWTIQNYIDFVLQMLLAFGISFEMPLLLVLLNIIGILPRDTLKKCRRHALLVCVILSTCIIPATDPISIAMLAGPLYGLFELALAVIWLLERSRRREEEVWPNFPQ